jgi:hypothetical protein
MLRRKLGRTTNDLKELRVKPTSTCCTNHSDMAKAKLSRIRITRQSKLLPLRRRRIRRMSVALYVDLLIIRQKVSKLQRKKTST